MKLTNCKGGVWYREMNPVRNKVLTVYLRISSEWSKRPLSNASMMAALPPKYVSWLTKIAALFVVLLKGRMNLMMPPHCPMKVVPIPAAAAVSMPLYWINVAPKIE
jgi:hypothetical protein